jgi:hypothetical protein
MSRQKLHFAIGFIHLGESMVKWTTIVPYEDSTMQYFKLYIKFQFCKFYFYKIIIKDVIVQIYAIFIKKHLQILCACF